MAWQFLKTRPLSVYEVAERFRKALLKEEARAARRMRSAYVDAERAILAELKRISKAIEDARRAGLDPRASWQIQSGRLEETLATIRHQIDGFSEIAARQTAARQTTAAHQGIEHARQLAKAAGVKSGWRLLSREQITDLIGFLEPGSPLLELFKAIGPRAASHARTVFAQASATGAHPRVTAKLLAKGIRDLSEDRALLIARTETLRSYRTATQRSYKANSDVVTGWRWMAAHSPRTCAMCLAMDGTIHSVDEVMATHPACRCAMVPVTPYSRDPRLTGAQWFAQQPDDVQIKIIGRGKHELYRSGQLELSDLVAETEHPRWGTGRREASLSEFLSGASLRQAVPRQTPEVFLGAASKSMGQPVSRMSSRLKGRVQEAMAEIDALHGAGNLEGVALPIKLTHSGAEGEFSFYRYGEPDHIALAPKTQIGTAAFVHEFGHFIDHFAGGFYLKGMSGLPESLPPHVRSAVVEFRKVANASREIQAIEAAFKNRGVVEIDGLSSVHSLGSIEYFLDPNEVWARAYAQYVAGKAKSKSIRRELESFRARHALGYASQWSDESFTAIAEAVEGILRVVGLMR